MSERAIEAAARAIDDCLTDEGPQSTSDIARLAISAYLAVVKKETQFRRANKIDGRVSHGMAKRQGQPPEYMIWRCMRSRCNNPNKKHYEIYGGRGIKICERWDDFGAFYEDMGPRPSPKHSIDRIDVNGNYEPGNCRWADTKEQARNKSTSVKVVRSDGAVFATIVDAAASVGVHKINIQRCIDGKQKSSGGYTWSRAALRALGE